MSVIETSNVSFRYPGSRAPALEDVSFRAGPGIIGLVGPNGAGKSTLLRLMAGLEPPTAGEIRVNGKPPSALANAGAIGLIPETPLFDEYLTVSEFIEGLGTLSDTNAEAAMANVAAIHDSRLGMLSLGQKRRVELAAATIGMPALLLLDEPTNGLDPFAVTELRHRVTTLRSDLLWIVFSSHHLDELQRIADTIVVLQAGRSLGCWTRDEVMRDHGSLEALFHDKLGTRTADQP
jgi:ABC-type multidrug transport system ATPase subunit